MQGQGREARENRQSEEMGTRVHRILGMLERSAMQGLVVPESHEFSKPIVVDSKLALGQGVTSNPCGDGLQLKQVQAQVGQLSD